MHEYVIVRKEGLVVTSLGPFTSKQSAKIALEDWLNAIGYAPNYAKVQVRSKKG